MTKTEALSDAIPQALINEATDCETWPMWLHDIVDRVTGVDLEHDMSTEQAIGLALLLSRRAANSAGRVEVKPVGYVTKESLAEVAAGRIGDNIFPARTLRPQNEVPLYTHLSSPVSAEVTEEAVERAAEVMWNDIFGARAGAWENPPADSVSGIQFRATARAALLAALNGGRENG